MDAIALFAVVVAAVSIAVSVMTIRGARDIERRLDNIEFGHKPGNIFYGETHVRLDP